MQPRGKAQSAAQRSADVEQRKESREIVPGLGIMSPGDTD
jgi:hypothetical protein